MVVKEAKRFQKEFLKQITVFVTAAFGLVAALAWNDAVQSIFRHYYGNGAGIRAKIVYALIVTALAVIVAIWIGKSASNINKK